MCWTVSDDGMEMQKGRRHRGLYRWGLPLGRMLHGASCSVMRSAALWRRAAGRGRLTALTPKTPCLPRWTLTFGKRLEAHGSRDLASERLLRMLSDAQRCRKTLSDACRKRWNWPRMHRADPDEDPGRQRPRPRTFSHFPRESKFRSARCDQISIRFLPSNSDDVDFPNANSGHEQCACTPEHRRLAGFLAGGEPQPRQAKAGKAGQGKLQCTDCMHAATPRCAATFLLGPLGKSVQCCCNVAIVLQASQFERGASVCSCKAGRGPSHH